jgi:hypothetical protein
MSRKSLKIASCSTNRCEKSSTWTCSVPARSLRQRL